MTAVLPLFRSLGLVAVLSTSLWSTTGWTQAQTQPHLDVPYVPTPQVVVDNMLKLADVQANDYLIDLGSGDGRIPITAAREFGTRGMGVDLNPVRVRESVENARKANVIDKVEFREQNLFDTKISDATVLTMYLLPRVNLELRPRLLSELRPGTRVVSHDFDMADWQPDQHIKVPDDGSDLYLWIIPAQVDGQWRLRQNGPQGAQEWTLDLKQHFQEISGTATGPNGRTAAITGGRLKGDQITFALGEGQAGQPGGTGLQFTGQVKGDGMQGKVGTGGQAAWTATRN